MVSILSASYHSPTQPYRGNKAVEEMAEFRKIKAREARSKEIANALRVIGDNLKDQGKKARLYKYAEIIQDQQPNKSKTDGDISDLGNKPIKDKEYEPSKGLTPSECVEAAKKLGLDDNQSKKVCSVVIPGDTKGGTRSASTEIPAHVIATTVLNGVPDLPDSNPLPQNLKSAATNYLTNKALYESRDIASVILDRNERERNNTRRLKQASSTNKSEIPAWAQVAGGLDYCE